MTDPMKPTAGAAHGVARWARPDIEEMLEPLRDGDPADVAHSVVEHGLAKVFLAALIPLAIGMAMVACGIAAFFWLTTKAPPIGTSPARILAIVTCGGALLWWLA